MVVTGRVVVALPGGCAVVAGAGGTSAVAAGGGGVRGAPPLVLGRPSIFATRVSSSASLLASASRACGEGSRRMRWRVSCTSPRRFWISRRNSWAAEIACAISRRTSPWDFSRRVSCSFKACTRCSVSLSRDARWRSSAITSARSACISSCPAQPTTPPRRRTLLNTSNRFIDV